MKNSIGKGSSEPKKYLEAYGNVLDKQRQKQKKFFEKNVYIENFQKTKNPDFWRPSAASNGFPQK